MHVQTHKLLPVLEPLSEATSSALKPFELYPNDYLEIALSADDENYFAVRAVASRRRVVRDDPDSIFPADEVFEEDPMGPSFNAQSKWTEKVPECRIAELKDGNYPNGTFLMAATDYTALIVHHQWPADRIRFLSQEAAIVYEFLLKRFLLQTTQSVTVANFKVNGIVPKMPADYIKHPELPIAGYQEVGVYCTTHHNKALYMQQGTGKTPTAINVVCIEASRYRRGVNCKPHMMRVLVICPKSVRGNWENEFTRFATVPGKTVKVYGDELNRLKRIADAVRPEKDWDCAFGAAIIGYSAAVKSIDTLLKIPWDRVILDEAHAIKWHRSLRWKTLKELRDVSVNRSILTGTPITQSLFDLWTQFEFLGEGLSGFLKFENFRHFYGDWEKNKQVGHGVERLLALKNLPLLQERLARLAYMITKKEAGLNLPEKLYDQIEVVMTKKQREYYAKMQNQLVLEISTAKSAAAKGLGKKMTAQHILTKLLRLTQITSGFVKPDAIYDPETGECLQDGHIEQINSNNVKVDAIVEAIKDDLESDPKGKKIIWCSFQEDVRRCMSALEAEGWKPVSYYGQMKDDVLEAAKHTFNKDPSCKVFVGTMSKGGEGSNLVGYDYENLGPEDEVPSYVDHEFFMSQNWSAVQRSQAEDRAHRRGMRAPSLRCTDVVVPGTIDEEIRQRTVTHRANADLIQDIQEILAKVLSVNTNGDDDE